MAFTISEQEKIVDILGLNSEQYRGNDANGNPQSYLKRLLDQIESDDTQYGTNLEGKIRTVLSQIGTTQFNLTKDEDNPEGIYASVTLVGQTSITYRDRPITTQLNNRLQQQVAQLYNLINIWGTLGRVENKLVKVSP